jgi:hypothetical protein
MLTEIIVKHMKRSFDMATKSEAEEQSDPTGTRVTPSSLLLSEK